MVAAIEDVDDPAPDALAGLPDKDLAALRDLLPRVAELTGLQHGHHRIVSTDPGNPATPATA